MCPGSEHRRGSFYNPQCFASNHLHSFEEWGVLDWWCIDVWPLNTTHGPRYSLKSFFGSLETIPVATSVPCQNVVFDPEYPTSFGWCDVMTQETWHSPISLKRKMVKARIADVQMGRLRRYQITEGQASYSKIRNNNKMNWRDITASPGFFCCSLFLEGGAQKLGCVVTDVCDWTVSHFLSTSSFSFEIWSLFRHSYLSLTP